MCGYFLLRPKEGRTDDEAVEIDSRIGQRPLPEIADLQPQVAGDGVTGAKRVDDVLLSVVFAGSVDRRFLANYMPGLEKYFHYRNLDVSSVKEIARKN